MARRTSKKAKVTKNTETSIAPCYFAKLPLELIAEILLYTQSPQDILSLSRCNKFYYNTLLEDANQFIWRYARNNCKPKPLPDPCWLFSEASYAAFVFDGGICENCGKATNSMYTSFALRLRFCRPSCARTFAKKNLLEKPDLSSPPQIFANTLPTVEADTCLPLFCLENTRYATWPDATRVFRTIDWSNALQDYLEASMNPDTFQRFVDECAVKADRMKKFMTMCAALHDWKTVYTSLSNSVDYVNRQITKEFAKDQDIDYWDLRHAPTFDALFKTKGKLLEKILPSEYEPIKAAVEAELNKVKESRARKKHEESYRESRETIEKHYKRLQIKKIELPSLQTFRDLPINRQLQTSTTPLDLTEELQKPVNESLTQSQLGQSKERARRELGNTLGFPDWRSSTSPGESETKLHPVDRLTARFRCRTCDRVDLVHKEDQCLDFVGAWTHTCTFTPDKKPEARPWKAGRFVVDEKATAAMTKLLDLCNIDSEDPQSHSTLKAIGARVLCLDCDGQIVMDPKSVIGHSHRHENMSMSLLTEEESRKILGGYPITRGLTIRLLGTEKKARGFRLQKVYGCRHCSKMKTKTKAKTKSRKGSDGLDATGATGAMRAASNTASAPIPAPTSVEAVAVAETGTSTGMGTGTTSAAPNPNPPAPQKPLGPLYNFEGLRSHLASKHKLGTPRDEDFYTVQDFDWVIPGKPLGRMYKHLVDVWGT